jgi:hypothetical protein
MPGPKWPVNVSYVLEKWWDPASVLYQVVQQHLERLARCCARPPFAGDRLTLAGPNTVVYALKKPAPRGRSALTLTPPELIQFLAALIPPPRVHRHRYAGLPAPNSPLRQQVIASTGPAGVLADRLAEAARDTDW